MRNYIVFRRADKPDTLPGRGVDRRNKMQLQEYIAMDICRASDLKKQLANILAAVEKKQHNNQLLARATIAQTLDRLAEELGV